MNRAKAIRVMHHLLTDEFKYIYESTKSRINEIHLFFDMDSKYELQSSMMFENSWVDILTFISPTAVNARSAAYMEVLKTVNFINWSSKSATGRMYLDNAGDIVISQRFVYDWLDKYPEIVIKEYESSIQYFEDLFTLLIDVAENRKSFKEAAEHMELMWDL